MTNEEIKLKMIDSLFNRGEWIKQVNDVEYRTRCPYCGDSQKNFNTGHLYIRINPDDNLPMFWNCFKCSESGVVNSDFLTMMGIDDINLTSNITTLNKTSDNVKANKFLNNIKTVYFDWKLPDIKRGLKTEYIEKRLGINLSMEELENIKVITSLREFLVLNKIKELLLPDYINYNIEDHYVGFLSYGSSHILFRDITNKEKFPWIKYPITKDSRQCRLFYSVSSEIDLFTDDIITINLAEGVLDILSAYLNLGYNNPNTLNIAVCGKQYINILKYLASIGFVGDNVILNIFADNDEKFNDNINNRPTDVKYFKKILYKVKYLYKEVNIYYNEKSKDIGIPKENIVLKKYKI